MSKDLKGHSSGIVDVSINLHRQVAQTLRERLLNGVIADGAKLPSLREMAKEFGVSTMTIRQAIHVLEQEGHLYRVSSAGTYVRPTNCEQKPTVKMVAFATMHLGNPFEIEIARSVEKACRQKGWLVQIFNAHADTELETLNMRRLAKSNSCGAIILHTGNPQNMEILHDLQQLNFPFVLINRSPLGIDTDIVESNHEQGAYLATKYLLERGHSQILMLIPPLYVSSIKERIKGYERALLEADIKINPKWKIWTDLEDQITGIQEKRCWLSGYKAIKPLLKKMKKNLAVFAADDCSGWGVYQACRELNLQIPKDVSVICFDDTDISRAMVPPMTAVAQRTEEIGHRVVELMAKRLQEIESDSEHMHDYIHSVIDVELIERQSVASPTVNA